MLISLSSRREKGLLLAASVCLTFGACWLLRPRPTLPQAAQALAHAAFAQDVDAIVQALPEPELSVNGLTRPEAKVIVSTLVIPRITRCVLSNEKGAFIPDKVRAAHMFEVKTPTGRVIPMAVVVEKGDKGAVSALGDWLKIAWYIDYFTKYPNAEFNGAAAFAYGYDNDREILARHRFKGFYRANGTPGGGLQPIDEAYAVWQAASKPQTVTARGQTANY